jgi:hypothetical protein
MFLQSLTRLKFCFVSLIKFCFVSLINFCRLLRLKSICSKVIFDQFKVFVRGIVIFFPLTFSDLPCHFEPNAPMQSLLAYFHCFSVDASNTEFLFNDTAQQRSMVTSSSEYLCYEMLKYSKGYCNHEVVLDSDLSFKYLNLSHNITCGAHFFPSHSTPLNVGRIQKPWIIGCL